MKKLIFGLLLAISGTAHAGTTNRDASVLATDTALQGIELCKAMMLNNGLVLHRAKWFKDNTENAQQALLAMIICDAYTRGSNDGYIAAQKDR